MSNAQTSTFTDSALSDKVKQFLTRFKDKQGNYRYVDAIDSVSYTHLTLPTSDLV